MKVWISKVIFLVFFISTDAFADYGSGTAIISCNKNADELTVSTYILWNEDYDAFLSANPLGFFLNEEKAVFPLDQIQDTENFKCELNGNKFSVKLTPVLLQILIGKDNIIYEYKDRYPYGRNIYGLDNIKKYRLNIKSNGEITECFALHQGEVNCKPYAK